jgi:hypothetical protein
MARVPITVMGCRCERCAYEWIPRDLDVEPEACPRCKSPYWNKPRKAGSTAPMTTFDEFKTAVEKAIRNAGQSLTWTEIRTTARLPQKFPNNQWVHQLEREIGLTRSKDANGIIKWSLS